MKTLSVIIPSFDRQLMTVEAIESVRSRFPEKVEIIIVDDHSVDPFNYHEHYNSSGISVRLIRLRKNVGAGVARGIGVQKSSGTYIAFLDSDDTYEPGWVDILLRVTELHDPQETLFLFGDCECGHFLQVVRYMISAMPNCLSLFFTKLTIMCFNPFPTPSVCLSKEICVFSPNLRYCEDYFTFANAIFRSKRIVHIRRNSFKLGRKMKSIGGLSASFGPMFLGELAARGSMLSYWKSFPLVLIVLPMGYIYQLLRTAIKPIVALISNRVLR